MTFTFEDARSLFVGLDGVGSGPVILHKRFRCEAGSDQICDNGKPLTHETAADLITEWRAKAVLYRQSRLPGLNSLRLARWCETDADELDAALEQARRWRRCMDAGSNRPAFADSVALLDGPEPPCAA